MMVRTAIVGSVGRVCETDRQMDLMSDEERLRRVVEAAKGEGLLVRFEWEGAGRAYRLLYADGSNEPPGPDGVSPGTWSLKELESRFGLKGS